MSTNYYMDTSLNDSWKESAINMFQIFFLDANKYLTMIVY